MATVETDQTEFMIVWKLNFDNGLVVIIAASPLSPELGRDILGQFTEDYTLIGLLRPYTRFYPFLKGIPQGQAYIKDRLGLDIPLDSLMYVLLPLVTSIGLADDILLVAERWYQSYYQSTNYGGSQNV